MKNVFKEIFSRLFSYFVFAAIIVVVYFDWFDKVDGGSVILGIILFWFYYEITAKDLQLRELNKKHNKI